MNDANILEAKLHPSSFDILLVAIGAVIFAPGYYMVIGSPWPLALGFVAGSVLGALAWLWPRIMGPVLLVLSIPAIAYILILNIYFNGLPNILLSLWGALAFLIGGLGVLRWQSAASQPKRHVAIQAAWVGSLAVVLLLYIMIMWPPQAKEILISLPIIKKSDAPWVQANAGGGWVAYWTIPRVSVPEALENAIDSLEPDGWTIIDTATSPRGAPMISAQRGAYSLYVIYDPEASSPYFRPESGGYIAAYVSRSQAGQIMEPDLIP